MNRKILVSSALATIFFGGLLQATATSTENSYAVFKYDTSSTGLNAPATGWNSFENDTNHFTSLATFDGQYANKTAKKNYLGIALGGTNGSVLSLQNLKGAFDKTDSMQVGVYVNVANVANAENMLQISTTNSTLVSNLRFVDSSKNYNNGGKTIANLTFDGNHTITTSDLTYVNATNMIKLGETVENGGTGNLIIDSQSGGSGTTGNDQYALVGAVFNSSGGTVNLTFTKGARMFGDVETKSSSNSKTTLTFGATSYEANAKQYFASDGKMKGTVFEGGITSNTSQTTLNLYRGSAYIHSVTSGTNGLLAQNNGANIINVGDKTTKLVNSGQTLRITEMKSQTNGGNYTYNYINFQNGINSTNSSSTTINQINVDTTITANHGQNFIVTQKLSNAESDLVINVGNAIATSSNASATLAKHNIRNFIDINGSLVVGKDGLKNYQNGATLGITTRVGITEITLRDSSDYSTTPVTKLPSNINTALGDKYNDKHSLSTSQIYATGSDIEGTNLSKYSLNSIKLEGDLTLIYKDFAEDTTRGIAGGRILSANGGLNRIEVNGTINVAKYYGGDNGGTSNIDPSKINANQMWILTTSYSGDYATGGNDIVIKNANKQDIALGSLYAFEGINNLVLNQKGETLSDKKITIQNMYASKTDLDGNVKKGGDNAVTVFDGSNITFTDITTQEGGRNVVYLLRKNITTGSDTTTTTFNNISYGVGGETEIVVGVRGTKDTSTPSNSPVDLFSHSKGVDITLKNDGSSHQVALSIARTGTMTGTGVVFNCR